MSPNVTSADSLEHEARFVTLKREVHERLLSCIDLSAIRTMSQDMLRTEFRRGAEEVFRQRPNLLTSNERRRLIDELVDETLGFGPLEPLLRDPDVSDILINGASTIFVERRGRLEQANVSFFSEEHLVQVLQKVVAKAGRRIDESSPMVDARLPDGSRINAVIRPLAIDGALVSIRRARHSPVTPETLLTNDSLTPPMLQYLIGAVRRRANILVSGGTGSGKTTLLGVLSSFIPRDQRIVTIEDAAELKLQQPHVARLESRPANVEGSGRISVRDLLRNALRMRPDRIVIGECRGEETLDMLQAMNTGHDGSMTTIHANSAADALSRLQLLVGLSGCDLSMGHIDRQIAAAINLIVHVARLPGGARKITQITELRGMSREEFQLHDQFRYQYDPTTSAPGTFVRVGAGDTP